MKPIPYNGVARGSRRAIRLKAAGLILAGLLAWSVAASAENTGGNVSVVPAAVAVAANSTAVPADLKWIDSWGTSHIPTLLNGRQAGGVPTFDNQTVRFNVFAKLAGDKARVKFTNKFGTEPVEIGAAHIALRESGAAIVPATDQALTFFGKTSVILTPGAEVWSDSAAIAIPRNSEVAISVFLPQRFKPTAFHLTGSKNMYLSAPGDFTAAATMPRATGNPATITSFYFVSGLEVLAPAKTTVIVAFGDSITDGANSDVDTNTAWPDLLAQRLTPGPDGAPKVVINMGIGSNRVVSADAAGPSGVHRFDDDVLSRANVTYIIVLEGINDISYEHATPEQLIGAYRELIAKAHAKGIKVYGATLLPILNSTKYTPENEVTRVAVNEWIRTSRQFDGVIDFEAAVRDPANPLSIRRDLTRDYVHPNSAGYKLMAEAINPEWFK